MTLREVCEAVGVSRRAVQGYENAGLVTATDKNKRGYLLYDKDTQNKIKRIKLFQDMGFSIKEIKEIINGPNEVLKSALEIRIEKLQKEGKHIDDMIMKAQEMIRQL